ncbi:hypothetical protein PC114_g28948 [Phytophthora cactorum]|nr:hypothetical protein PC114_g28948 [Phytophthora cactorum]
MTHSSRSSGSFIFVTRAALALPCLRVLRLARSVIVDIERVDVQVIDIFIGNPR